MGRGWIVSRRKLVTLAAGSAAATAVPAALIHSQKSPDNPADLFAASRQRVLRQLVRVREARETAVRAEEFATLALAIQLHDAAAFVFDHTSLSQRANAAPNNVTALYHGPKPETVLARVIVRELEATPMHATAWLTRFADLESAIQSQAV